MVLKHADLVFNVDQGYQPLYVNIRSIYYFRDSESQFPKSAYLIVFKLNTTQH